jgi:hypothetical protein
LSPLEKSAGSYDSPSLATGRSRSPASPAKSSASAWLCARNCTKVFVSVKLWPVGWALLSSFTARRPVTDALADETGGNAFIAATLLYFMIPGLSFLVIHLATSAAAIPFKEAAPAVVGPSNGPVGDAARMAVQRIR